ncbi:hypothetical protein J1605_015452 [Eschrichtius robustus]|uniref:RRM domain-containing protein n=1 Tax=Eschrichtius robustus TaxID=9764 RepID=A0AB34G9J7_ESCRO|nr:hypothetical protein J1605_015452 [Eschrichtius robustus]
MARPEGEGHPRTPPGHVLASGELTLTRVFVHLAVHTTFGELKTVRLPKKMTGIGRHRGFGFVDFLTKQDAKVRILGGGGHGAGFVGSLREPVPQAAFPRPGLSSLEGGSLAPELSRPRHPRLSLHQDSGPLCRR